MKRVFIALVLILSIGLVSAQETPLDPEIGLTTAGFYDWYIGHVESNNFNIGDVYRDSPYLTASFIDQLDEIYASPERRYDPILCSQALPDFYALEVRNHNESSATVLMRLHFSSPLTHNFMVELVNETDNWQINNVICADTVSPQGIVQKFYDDWLAYRQFDVATGTRNNPIVDRLWRDSQLVTDNLKQRLDAFVDNDTTVGFDPVLFAQDIPSRIVSFEIDVVDNRARVLVNAFFGDFAIPHRILVHLQDTEDGWRIDAITDDVPPDVIALSFYHLYIDFARYDLDYGIDRTRLWDWGLNWGMFLTESLQGRLYSTFGSAEALPADPVLCAQDIPSWVEINPIESNENSAKLHVEGMYPSGAEAFTSYDLATLEITTINGRWIIDDIVCGMNN